MQRTRNWAKGRIAWQAAFMILAVFVLSTSTIAYAQGKGSGGTKKPIKGPNKKTQDLFDLTTWCVVILNPIPALYLPAPAGGAVPAPFAGTTNLPPGYAFAAGGALPGGAGKFNILQYDARMFRHTVGGAVFRLSYSDGAAGAKAAGLRWKQVITTNKPLGAAVWPYCDPAVRATDASMPPYPFYKDETPAGSPFSDTDCSNNNPAAGAGAVDYIFGDAPRRSCWTTNNEGQLMSMHASWTADLRGVTWDRVRGDGPAVGAAEAGASCMDTVDNDGDTVVNDGCMSTVTLHDGVRWGFDLWPLHHRPRTPRRPPEQHSPEISIFFDDNSETASFAPAALDQIIYADGTEGATDPARGAQIKVSGLQVQILEEIRDDGRGAFFPVTPDPGGRMENLYSFQNGSIEITQGSEVLLTADLLDVFLHIGTDDPRFDSEFEAHLANVRINNAIRSRYLEEIQAFLDNAAENQYIWAVRSNILEATQGLSLSNGTSGPTWLFAFTSPGPEVEVCHIPPGNPENAHTIAISLSAIDAHLAHGDMPGACQASDR